MHEILRRASASIEAIACPIQRGRVSRPRAIALAGLPKEHKPFSFVLCYTQAIKYAEAVQKPSQLQEFYAQAGIGGLIFEQREALLNGVNFELVRVILAVLDGRHLKDFLVEFIDLN